jgi:hypothetical protein
MIFMHGALPNRGKINHSMMPQPVLKSLLCHCSPGVGICRSGCEHRPLRKSANGLKAKMTRTGHTDVIHRAFKAGRTGSGYVTPLCCQEDHPPNHVLCAEGEVAKTLFVVMSGRVVISRRIEGDEEFVLGFLGPGGFFGEMALLTGESRAATVTTITETDVLEITKEQFEEVFNASPSMARSILETLAHTISK